MTNDQKWLFLFAFWTCKMFRKFVYVLGPRGFFQITCENRGHFGWKLWQMTRNCPKCHLGSFLSVSKKKSFFAFCTGNIFGKCVRIGPKIFSLSNNIWKSGKCFAFWICKIFRTFLYVLGLWSCIQITWKSGTFWLKMIRE